VLIHFTCKISVVGTLDRSVDGRQVRGVFVEMGLRALRKSVTALDSASHKRVVKLLRIMGRVEPETSKFSHAFHGTWT